MSTINAKTEFLNHVTNTVKCAVIKYCVAKNTTWYVKPTAPQQSVLFVLPEKHCPQQLSEFICSLDFEYNNTYGEQALKGFIWYEDGRWSERMNSTGLELWNLRTIPEYYTTIKELK